MNLKQLEKLCTRSIDHKCINIKFLNLKAKMSAQNTVHPTKRSLQNFQWDFGKPTKESLASVRASATWLLPQLMSFLGTTIQPQWVDHKISSQKTFQVLGSRLDNAEIVFDNGRVLHKQEMATMLQLCTHAHSSHLFAERQTSEFGSRYSAAVPLVLSALRQYQDISYSAWDFSDPAIQHFLTPALYDMVVATAVLGSDSFSTDLLLQIRGDEDSTKYSACTGVNRSKLDADFYMLPRLAKLQLTQTWIYHPSHRHPLQLGLGYALDVLAPPLVDTNVLQKPGAYNPNLLPWQ